jgi:hypothetical protein
LRVTERIKTRGIGEEEREEEKIKEKRCNRREGEREEPKKKEKIDKERSLSQRSSCDTRLLCPSNAKVHLKTPNVSSVLCPSYIVLH